MKKHIFTLSLALCIGGAAFTQSLATSGKIDAKSSSNSKKTNTDSTIKDESIPKLFEKKITNATEKKKDETPSLMNAKKKEDEK